MKTKLLKAALIASVFASVSCSNNPENEQVINKIQAEKIKNSYETQLREQELNSVPDWYLNSKDSDDNGVLGVGNSSSTNLDFAFKSAKLKASMEVAKVLKAEVSGQERSYLRSSGEEGTLANREEMIVDLLVKPTSMTGYETIKKEVKIINGRYQAFVMVRLPYNSFNKLADHASNDSLKNDFDQAFDKLEKRLKDRQNDERDAIEDEPVSAQTGI